MPVIEDLISYNFGFGYWGVVPLLLPLLIILDPREVLRRYPIETAFLGLSTIGLAVLALYLAPHWGLDYFFNATYLRFYMVIVPLMYLLVLNLIFARIPRAFRPSTP